MRRLLLLVCLFLIALPAAANAAPDGGLYVLSQRDNTENAGITGLIKLSDGGGESQIANVGGFKVTGGAGGLIVFSGTTIKQYNGAGGYTTLASGVGSGTRSMTYSGRGLVVADGSDTLKLLSGSTLVPMTASSSTVSGEGPWLSVTTMPNGHVLGWAYASGYGKLYEFNLGDGSRTEISVPTGMLYNNRDQLGNLVVGAPAYNSGGISADGQGGIWVATAGTTPAFPTLSSNNQVFYAAPGGSFNSIATGYTNPNITTTGSGEAYVTNTDNTDSPYFADVYKVRPNGDEDLVTLPAGDLVDSWISGLTVDRCYTSCSVAPPNLPVQPTTTTIGPLTAPAGSVKLGSSGLPLKLSCAVDCSVVVTGSLSVGGKASAAGANTLKKVKVKLKAGKTKTVRIKLSKAQKKKVKAALKKKKVVTAKLKLAVTPKTGKKTSGKLSLRVK